MRAVSTAVDGNGLPMLAVFIVANVNQTAKATNLSRQTVYRIKVLTRDGQVRVIEVPADGSEQ